MLPGETKYSTLTLYVGQSVALGTYGVVVNGDIGIQSHTSTINLTVTSLIRFFEFFSRLKQLVGSLFGN